MRLAGRPVGERSEVSGCKTEKNIEPHPKLLTITNVMSPDSERGLETTFLTLET